MYELRDDNASCLDADLVESIVLPSVTVTLNASIILMNVEVIRNNDSVLEYMN